MFQISILYLYKFYFKSCIFSVNSYHHTKAWDFSCHFSNKKFILGVYKEKNIYYIYICKNEKHKKVFIYNIKGKIMLHSYSYSWSLIPSSMFGYSMYYMGCRD